MLNYRDFLWFTAKVLTNDLLDHFNIDLRLKGSLSVAHHDQKELSSEVIDINHHSVVNVLYSIIYDESVQNEPTGQTDGKIVQNFGKLILTVS